MHLNLGGLRKSHHRNPRRHPSSPSVYITGIEENIKKNKYVGIVGEIISISTD